VVTERIIARFCGAVTSLTLAALALATLSNELALLRNSTLAEPYPMTIYQQMATPGTATATGSRGAAGADFSQVYTSAMALRHGESAYRPKSREFADRFGRPPGYPPLMNWIAVPLSLLDYTDAFLLYTALALLSLLGATAWLLWKAGFSRDVGRVLLAQACLYLLTPIGLTHLERGQFDSLVATAAALCVGCVFLTGNTLTVAVVAGLLGALKWTSAAFLGCFSLLGFLLSSGRKRWSFFLLPPVMLLGTLPFWPELVDYWKTIRVYEIEAKPYGLTLQYYLPRAVARAAPVAMTLIVAGLAFVRFRSPIDREAILKQISAPFAIALMNLAVCFGTLSYEYHTVATLGMIPALVIWTRSAGEVRSALKASVCGAFAAFLLVAFRVYGFGAITPERMTAIYAGFALLFFGACLYTIARPNRTVSA
jgi:hypothetical protein